MVSEHTKASVMTTSKVSLAECGSVSNVQSGLNVDMSGQGAPAGDYGAMMNGGARATVINNYNNDNSRTVNQTNNSPKSLSRLEIYRMTRNALNV